MLLEAGEILRKKQCEYPLFPIPFSGSVGRGGGTPSSGFIYLRLSEPSDQAERTNHEIQKDKMEQERHVHL